MKQIKISYATIRYTEPIVSVTFNKNIELGFPEMRELTVQAEKLSNHKPYVVFCDMRMNVQVTREGRKTVADKKEVPLKRGSAFLVDQHELGHTTDFFSEIKSPDYPFRFFTDKQKAIKWLLKIPVKK